MVALEAQLEAHRQEALAWRTRAAQLDMAMRELQNDMVVKGGSIVNCYSFKNYM